jgi:hypothetical protein
MSALRVFFLSNGHEPFVQNIGLERVHGRPIGMFGLAGWLWDSEVRASRASVHLCTLAALLVASGARVECSVESVADQVDGGE